MGQKNFFILYIYYLKIFYFLRVGAWIGELGAWPIPTPPPSAPGAEHIYFIKEKMFLLQVLIAI